jgi:FkbM family methyltransferase
MDRCILRKIIYDVGANNGDDIPYYLMKADTVVAIEANPVLSDLIIRRFASEIADGRIVVENCAVTAGGLPGEVDFYVHRWQHVLSQMSKPQPEQVDQFDLVRVPSTSILDIISRTGEPYYIKVDIEHYDAAILRSLFEAGIRPPYISAESHTADVFALLVSLGHYDSFKLVEGGTVSRVYADRVVFSESENASIVYSFPDHSAGPFGEDIDGRWMNADNFLRLLALNGLGWKDIHATNCISADPSISVSAVDVSRAIFGNVRSGLGRPARALGTSLRRPAATGRDETLAGM